MPSRTTKPRRAISSGDPTLSLDNVDHIRLDDQFAMTSNGLLVDGQPAIERWASIVPQLRASDRGHSFAIGDFANELEDRFGEEAAQVLDVSAGWSLKTLENYRWVARNVPLSIRRMDRLTMNHHQLVAKSNLTEKQREKWLKKAAADGEEEPWTVRQLRDAMKKSGELEDVFWVIVKCPNGQVQSDLVERLQSEGLPCEAKQAKRAKKKPKKPAKEAA